MLASMISKKDSRVLHAPIKNWKLSAAAVFMYNLKDGKDDLFSVNFQPSNLEHLLKHVQVSEPENAQRQVVTTRGDCLRVAIYLGLLPLSYVVVLHDPVHFKFELLIFHRIDNRKMWKEIYATQKKLVTLEKQFDNLETRFHNVEKRLNNIEQRFNDMEHRFDDAEAAAVKRQSQIIAMIQDLKPKKSL